MTAAAAETIRPSVLMPDGTTVYPPGWMYVMAFALRGVPWAVREVESGWVDRAADLWGAEREGKAFQDGAGI